MARHRTQGRVRRQIQDVFMGNAGGIAGLLSAEQVERAVQDHGLQYRDCLFTPLITLWTFLAQVLSPDGSCRQAVAKLLAFLAASDRGGQEFQPDTGPYCKAGEFKGTYMIYVSTIAASKILNVPLSTVRRRCRWRGPCRTWRRRWRRCRRRGRHRRQPAAWAPAWATGARLIE